MWAGVPAEMEVFNLFSGLVRQEGLSRLERVQQRQSLVPDLRIAIQPQAVEDAEVARDLRIRGGAGVVRGGGGLQQVLHLVHRVGRLDQVGGSGQRVVHPGRRRVDQAGGGVQQVLHFVRGVGPGVDHDGVDGGGVEDVPVADQVGHTQWHFTFFPLYHNHFFVISEESPPKWYDLRVHPMFHLVWIDHIVHVRIFHPLCIVVQTYANLNRK